MTFDWPLYRAAMDGAAKRAERERKIITATQWHVDAAHLEVTMVPKPRRGAVPADTEEPTSPRGAQATLL